MVQLDIIGSYMIYMVPMVPMNFLQFSWFWSPVPLPRSATLQVLVK